MAAPITHVALAANVFDRLFKDKTKKDFFVGTLFPDIRYLKVIKREQTHPPRPAMNNFTEEDSFSAGLKLHSLIDITREKFIVKSGAYSLLPESKHATQALKMFEDCLFYSRINDWQKYIKYLDDVLPAETGFGVSSSDIERWHTILQKYFQSQPDEHTINEFGHSLGFSISALREINFTIDQLKTNKEIISIIEGLEQSLPLLIL